MIELALRADASDLSEADEVVVGSPGSAIEHTFFVVPVRFSVAGVDLLAYPDVYADWRPLPVLGFASQLRRTVMELEPGQAGTVSLEDGGALKLCRKGANFTIEATLIGVQVTVSRDELMAAVTRFSGEAASFAQSVAPSIVDHPVWGEWRVGLL